MRDQGGFVRSFVKWDDQPASPEGLVEAFCRANIATRSAPTAPVYICLDAGLQEAKLEKEPEWPDLARFTPPEPARPAKRALDAAVAILSESPRPVILAGRGTRDDGAWQARIRLAERLGAVVMSDLKSGAMFPTDHPAHVVPPFNQLGKSAREILCQADAILALDWVDLGGVLKQAAKATKVSAKIVAASLDQTLHSGAGMEYQALPPTDVFMAATSDAVVNELLEALGPGKKAPWKERVASKHRNADGDAVTLEGIAAALRAEFNDPDKVTFCLLNRGWPSDLWPFRSALAYLGKDGGGGLGSGPGLSVGSAVALAEIGRYAVSVLGDGDFCMGATAIWTAVKHRIPLLVLIDNNRSYFNDELHQESVAKTRGRDPRNRWIGLRMEDPMPDIATLAKGQGAVGIGPVTKATDVQAALERGVGVLKQGGVAVVDFHVDPGEERRSAGQSRHPYDK
jgi:thiamine pyrophosphate-dependent acetolactate synthase large subunit-like protein